MKTAFITGISSDIGLSIANELLKNNYKIIGTYLNNKDKLYNIKDNDNVILYSCDLRKEEDVKYIYYDLKEKGIKIDVIINNACIYHDNIIDNKTKTEFLDILDVNVVGTFLIVKHLSNLMNKGTIINISSSDGVNTYNEFNFDYACSKAALINFTKSLSVIFKRYKVYALSPNWVDTRGTNAIDKEYLKKEMKKAHQSRLITLDEMSACVLYFINSNEESGSNYLINIDKDGKLIWKKVKEKF